MRYSRLLHSHLDLIPDPFADNFEHSLYRIKIEKIEADLKSMSGKLVARERACNLLEVKDSLVSMGIPESEMEYSITNFNEHLNVNVNKVKLRLDIPLFPKRKKSQPISLQIPVLGRNYSVPRESTPESVANFLIDISKWIPEYEAYMEGLVAKQKQRELACDISMDILKKTIGEKLSEKGYRFDMYRMSGNKASMCIMMSDAVTLSLDVDLLGDFLEQTLVVAESLPITDYKPEVKEIETDDIDQLTGGILDGLVI